MIGKVMQNDSFRATTGYVLGKPGARIIGGNMVGSTVDALVAEFSMSRDRNRMIRHPVLHVSLSLPHDESLADRQLADLGERYLEGMGLNIDEHQFTIVRHIDCQHEHAHIVASRINLRSGLVANDSFERYRSQVVIRQLEHDFNLTPVPNSWAVGQRSQTKGQLEIARQTGIESVQKRLQTLIETRAKDAADLMQFLQLMAESGVDVMVYSDAQTKAITGISYRLDHVKLSGTDLGNRYTFPGLQRTFHLPYEPEKDNAQIQNCLAQTDRVNAIAIALLDTARLLQRYRLQQLDGPQYRLSLQTQPQRALVLQRKRETAEGLQLERLAAIRLEPSPQAIGYALTPADVEHFERQQVALQQLLRHDDQGVLQSPKIEGTLQL